MCFFYSPLQAAVMAAVVQNIRASLEAHPRDLHLIFYGRNPQTIQALEASGLRRREVFIPRDRSRSEEYRTLIYSFEPSKLDALP